MAAGHVHAQCRVQGRQVQVLCMCSAVLHAAHQDSLEPKQQQQDGEAKHEEAFGLSALELRSGHEAVSCGVAGRWAQLCTAGLGRTFLRSTARESSSSWLPFSMTDGESPSRVSVARSAMFEAASSELCVYAPGPSRDHLSKQGRDPLDMFGLVTRLPTSPNPNP